MNSNPFSTRYVRPGAIPFQFLNGLTLADLIARIDSAGEWQIVGAHGTGKSTLLRNLRACLADQGCEVALHVAPKPLLWHHVLPRLQMLTTWIREPTDVLLLDAGERLTRIERRLLCRAFRRRRRTLVLTAHRDIGCKTLYETAVNAQTLKRVLKIILADRDTSVAEEFLTDVLLKDAATLIEQYDGNLREILFELYDRWRALSQSK